MHSRQTQLPPFGQAPKGKTFTLCLALVCSLETCATSFPEFNPSAPGEYLLAVAPLALREAGTNADTCLIVAHVESDLGRTAEAEVWARMAVALAQTSAEAQVFLARLLIRQDRMQEAAVCLRTALRLDSKLEGAGRLLGMTLERLGDAKGAEDALQRVLEHNPRDCEAGFLLGRLLLDQGRAEQAIVYLEQACQADPESASGYYVLYQAQARAGETNAAQKSLETFQHLKKDEQARTVALESKQSDERNLRNSAANFHNQLAVVLQRSGQATNAEAHLRQAIVVGPEQPLAYQRLAALCLKTGRLREAEGFFAVLERLQPGEPGYAVNRGTVLLQLKDYPEAVRAFQGVLRIDPDQPEALNNLARLYLTIRQELPEALAMSRRLVATQPTAAHYDLLAWALYLNQQTNDALEACNQAIRRDPDNPAYLERRRRLQRTVEAAH